MLTPDQTFGRHKFMCLFSMITHKLNEWMNFQKKVMCTPKDPRAHYALTLCLSSQLHLMGTASAAHAAPKLLCPFLSLSAEFLFI